MQEVEAICDRVIIIDKGLIVANEEIGKIQSVISQPRHIVEVEFDRMPDEGLIRKLPGITDVTHVRGSIFLIETEGNDDPRSSIFRFAVENNLTVLAMKKHESNLEEIFRKLTT
jgi:ABC-2 type transport system ATP-binding protein